MKKLIFVILSINPIVLVAMNKKPHIPLHKSDESHLFNSPKIDEEEWLRKYYIRRSFDTTRPNQSDRNTQEKK